jgi:hypothetical protein
MKFFFHILRPPTYLRPSSIISKNMWAESVVSAVGSVSYEQWSSSIQELGSFNRYYNQNTGAGEGLRSAGDYLMAELSEILAPVGSRMIAPIRQDPLMDSLESYNIVAGIMGSVSPDRFVVIGAHMDSISEDPQTAAPGVVDNASGCAAVLEIARALALICTEYVSVEADICTTTFYFAFWTGEEAGLLGSTAYVANMNETVLRNNLVVAHVMDMVAYWARPDQTSPRVIIESYPRHLERLTASYSYGITHCIDGLQLETVDQPWGSDHMPFLDYGGQDAGVFAGLVIDSDYELYPDYHRTTDTFDKTNDVQALEIIRMSIGALAHFAFLDTYQFSSAALSFPPLTVLVAIACKEFIS